MATLKIKRLFIVGETATGKSKLTMQLAQRYKIEIICADSVTTYKEFDIGSAKPSTEDQKTVQHHMLDVATADEGYNVAKYSIDAEKHIVAATNRGALPVVVGGSGLYVDSLLYAYEHGEKSDTETRNRLSKESLSSLQSKAKKFVDPEDHSVVDWKNPRRLIRIIENGGIVAPVRSPFKISENDLIVGLRHTSAKERRNAIENRIEKMFRQGLRREVEYLKSKYEWELEPMKSVGYREFRKYYDDRCSMSKVKREIVRNTLTLAKQQRTWFKRNRSINWFDDATRAYKFIEGVLSSSGNTVKSL